jgi:two-component system, LytTR family, response regulator
MIRCLIVDDEPLAISLLENHIAQIPFLSLSGKCFHALETLDFLQKNTVDLVFLDINMPHLTGMQLKVLLPENQRVIFTTAYSEYAVESYEKNAVDYLLKPITFERFLKSVLKFKVSFEKQGIEKSNETNSSYTFIKSGKEIIQINYDEILYIEGLKDYVSIVTENQKIVTYKRMKDLEECLPEQFQRVHLSFIVNMDKIQKITDNQIVIGEDKISLSDKYREVFLERIGMRMI